MTELVHRALAAAALYAVGPRPSQELRVLTQIPETAEADAADLVVITDSAALDEPALERARIALHRKHGTLAIVASSTAASGILGDASFPDEAAARAAGAPMSIVRTAQWAVGARRGPIAPAMSVARLREVAEHAARAGLELVEPDHASTLRGLKTPRSAIDRAVLAHVLLGAFARPLLFLPRAAAPKNGLVRVREERALDGWIAARASLPRTAASPLLAGALAALAERAERIPGKELLREARARSGTSPSTSDGATLAKGLVAAWTEGVVDLYAVP
jgi:hypothetical protein